ncbi:DNA gyrase subunit A [Clostridium cylindrosporum]|uniref:DNA gyrase subunit A n=1 Tax=Clostridium cylindrosporum DSM 605 TaxID=1121307 RepID=A0A0J8D6M4_CLOCY|nr:DNA gyrase subunit A [Clostridium cylindrosporum]KMT21735.1 DNA gyrase subunit A [Clostridium cylindrosporum DSM 605]
MDEIRDKIIDRDIAEEMQECYIDYAMSVIVGRALPDVRDGLKPVHRRILYSMHELGIYYDKKHRKSARIVGDVLGKYHPHGDTAVYDAMVRLAQDFSTRYPLVDGHGNFGSVDGDSAAAMRYTEAKMSKIAMEILRDINKDTVDFADNFDGSEKEPKVLPSRFPNLLVNGSSGIAVGMATNMPPHNLGEIIDGTVMVIDDPEVTVKDIMTKVKGPDFPTAATILGREGIRSAYETGRGRIIVRAKAEIEEEKGRHKIVVTELPYQVNKAKLIENIAALVKEKKIEGISDLRDESDRDGMRIVIELKRDANSSVVLNLLYKHTKMRDTFGVINLALVNGEPKVLNLKELIVHYLDHQKEIIRRRSQFDLNKAEARAHILEGLRIALDHIDEVIKVIRASKTTEIARNALMENFALSERQAQAILDMRLQRLTGLEREKIESEYNQLMETIAYLKAVLASEKMVLDIIKEELLEIRSKYADERRTSIENNIDEINIEDLIDEEDVAVTITHAGYIKRLPSDTYKSQKRGGRGIQGLATREDDFVENLFITSTHDNILFFTNLGRAYKLKAYEIPEAGRTAKGTNIVNILPLQPQEKIETVITIKEFEEDKTLVFATRKGVIKKSKLTEFATIRKTGINAITLREDDELISVKLTDGTKNITIVTRNGYSITFKETDVRCMGRTASGVKGITLREDDIAVSMEIAEEGHDLLVVSENGFGKRTSFENYTVQGRGGKGVITYKVTKKTGIIISARAVENSDEIMIINNSGIIIRLEVSGISTTGRNAMGVTLMRADDGQKIVSVAKVNTNDTDIDDDEIQE